VGWVGRVLVGVGVLLLLFVAYQLWGTNLAEARSQEALRRAFDRSLTTTTTASVLPSSSPASTTTAEAPPSPPAGEAVAVLRIPAIGVDKAVIEGVGVPDLKKGPGHYPTSARIGAIGNVVISGHRTTYLAPFNRVDELHAGDPIVLETQSFWYTYTVTAESVVQPTAIEVTYPVPGHLGGRPTQRLLTLTTCNPKYSARTRLIVHATLTAPLAKGSGVVPAALDQVLKG
jgi:sortase A